MEEFVHATTSTLGPQPPNFQAIVALNRGPLVTGAVELQPLTPRQVEQRQGEGVLIVDVRTDLQFDDAHIPGSVCNPAVRAGFGTKLAWVAARDREVVLVGRDDADAIHAAHLAAAVGIRNIAGYLAGGMISWREENRPTRSLERIDVTALYARRDEVQVLDVRERSEWDRGHIPGSIQCRTATSTGSPKASIQISRSRSSAPPDSAAQSPRRCSSATAHVRSSTSPTEASEPGRGRAGRSNQRG